MSPDRPRVTGGLGRLVAEDRRDLNYLMRAFQPAPFSVPLSSLPESITYRRGKLLDQGNTGTCVEHSLEALLRASPMAVGEKRLPKRYEVYDEATRIDEFAGNEIERDPRRQYGTSIRAGCKALKRRGLIESYHWAYDVDEVLHWMLGSKGGVVLGIDWYSGMDRPDDEGIIRATGRPLGGHAIYGFRIDRVRALLTLQNSWGPAYGGWMHPSIRGQRIYRGCVQLPLDDLKKLMSGNGEAVAIVESPYRR